MRKMIAGLATVAALGVAGCEMPEEPDSYSEQGKTTQEAATKPAKNKKDKKPEPARPRWIGHMVKAILGKPDETDSTEMESFEGGTTVMDSWTYGEMFSSKDGDDIWMLSFTDGELDSKTRM